jgi:hypothetical protein
MEIKMNAELNRAADNLERFVGSGYAASRIPEGSLDWPARTFAHAGAEEAFYVLLGDNYAMMLAYVSANLGEPAGSGGDASYLLEEAKLWRSVTSTASLEDALSALGKRFARSEGATKAQAPVLPAADLVAEIKATLGINVTELAGIAKVSRQTLYDWIDGGTISEKNYERLFALRQVCGAWRGMAKKPIGKLVHARTEDQTSLFDLLQQDELDQTRIHALLEMLAAKAAESETERQQRASKLERLSEKAYRESLLIHSRPATDS